MPTSHRSQVRRVQTTCCQPHLRRPYEVRTSLAQTDGQALPIISIRLTYKHILANNIRFWNVSNSWRAFFMSLTVTVNGATAHHTYNLLSDTPTVTMSHLVTFPRNCHLFMKEGFCKCKWPWRLHCRFYNATLPQPFSNFEYNLNSFKRTSNV